MKSLKDRIKIVKLEKKVDERGWLMEIFKSGYLDHKEFGQLLVTVAKPGITKGGHYHTRKEEWFCVIQSDGVLYLRDIKTKEKMEIKMGDSNPVAIQIPTYALHSIKNVDPSKDLILLAYVNEVFNPNDTDTFKESEYK